jgi:hypothetical protein
MSLIEYYSDKEEEEKVAKILEDMSLFFENFFEDGYVPLKPVSIDDFRKLEELDLHLATRIFSLSRGSIEYIYQDYLYQVTGRTLGGNGGIDQFVIPLLVDMYKVETSRGLYEEEEDVYSKVFALHQESFMSDFQEDEEKLDVIVRYFPFSGVLIQDYLYNMYLEDKDSFVSEVSKLNSYIFTYSTMRNKYTISNLLQLQYKQ